MEPALDTDQPTGQALSEVSRLAALARRKTEVGSYQARGGKMFDFQIEPAKMHGGPVQLLGRHLVTSPAHP